jgi:ribosomal protein S18 acetylase RimI-like enzyme
MSITNINLSSNAHKEIIMKLCDRNKFYKEDVYIEINRDFPPAFKEIQIKLFGISEYNKKIDGIFKGLEHFGYFITVEENSRKKVVGFIIYNIEKIQNKSYLSFILIDKKYQKNSFGTKLVNKYIKEVEEKKLFCATVKVENELVANFYHKFGFDKHSDLIETEVDEKYEILHYFPKGSAKALKLIKSVPSDILPLLLTKFIKSRNIET